METSHREEGGCVCGVLRALSEETNSVVIFDDALSEFRLQSRDGTAEDVMYYCFACGKKLPVSRRNDLFVEARNADIESIHASLETLETISDVERILGPPDGEEQSGNLILASERIVKQVWYSRYWESAILIVNVLESGRFTYAISQRRK